MRRLLAWLLLVGLLAGPALADEAQPLPREVQELLRAQELRSQRQEQAAHRLLQKAKPVEIVWTDSLSLRGDGLGGLPRADDLTPPIWTLQLDKGRLLVTTGQDFEVLSYRFHLDTRHGFAEEHKAQQAQAEAWAPWLPKLPADWRRQSAAWQQELKQVRSAADLALLEVLPNFRSRLTGPLALQPGQIERLRAASVRRQALAEELGRLAQLPAPDAAAKQRIVQVFGEYPRVFEFAWQDGDLFTAAQRQALGYDPDPNAPPPPPRRAVVAAVSSSSGNAPAGDPQVQAEQVTAEQKERDRLQAEIKAQRAAAKVKFTLQGREARRWNRDLPTGEGLLRVWSEANDLQSASFTFHLDPQETWAREKARRLRSWEVYLPELKGQEAQEARQEFERYKQELNAAPSQHHADWGSWLNRLRAKTGAVPPDVQQRFDRMIAELNEATVGLLAAYQAALEKPGEPQRERALFDALRHRLKVEARGETLLRRQDYDPENARADLPWLLNMEQIDLVNQGTLTTLSSVTTTASGTLSIRGRPVGEKQYLAISAEDTTLGDLVETVQHTARRYYHNHRLQLKVAPEALDKPVRGLVEGKSAEELFQSLALRAGASLEKDKQAPHGWLIKP